MCLFLERERDLPPRGAVLGHSWTLCWRSWAALGAYVAGLWALLGLCWRSWAVLGTYVGGPGPLLGPMLAVLGRSWDLYCRSWAALGAYVGGPGAALGAYVGGLGASWGLSGRSWKGIRAEKWPWLGQEGELSSDQGGKVARTRAGARFSEARIARIAGLAGLDRIALGARYQFFL